MSSATAEAATQTFFVGKEVGHVGAPEKVIIMNIKAASKSQNLVTKPMNE
jgi:hypothetical protein